VQRMKILAGIVARSLGADDKLAERAAELSKADLLTGMVTEFPELQGVMGRYYALHDGEPPEVAEAIEAHYRPRFAGDQLPQNGYDLMPSELFKRQCYLVGWYDRASLRVRDYIGTENILWSSQFPQATSTWPNTKAALEKSFVGVAEGDKRKILWDNAATLYKIAVN